MNHRPAVSAEIRHRQLVLEAIYHLLEGERWDHDICSEEVLPASAMSDREPCRQQPGLSMPSFRQAPSSSPLDCPRTSFDYPYSEGELRDQLFSVNKDQKVFTGLPFPLSFIQETFIEELLEEELD